MIVAGIGFQRAATASDIVELCLRALDRAGLSDAALGALATIASRADEPAFKEAAERLDAEAMGIAPDDLRASAGGVVTHSPRIQALHGVGSVAEASALAGAGSGSTLTIPRMVSDGITCALASRP